MRPNVLPLRTVVMVVALAACGAAAAEEPKKEKSDNAGKIEGTKWSSLEGTIKGNKLPAGIIKMEFSKEGKLVYTIGSMVLTGTYELKAGNKVTLKLDKELEGRTSHDQKIVIKDGRLAMSDSDGTTLDFEKAK